MNTVRSTRVPGKASHPEPLSAPRLTAVRLVPVAALREGDSPRACTDNPEHLQMLAAAESSLPPIVVHRATMRVIDGMHRLRAAVLRGRTEIEVQFFDGSEEDAFVFAVESNTRHGLALTFAERSAAAVRILRSHPHWADRAIASVTGLSAHTVTGLRRGGAVDREASPPVRLGRDGRVRPLNTAHGRREAGRLLMSSPDVSLREIARRTGISPATVRDVRDRVLRGLDPVPERMRADARPVRPAPRQLPQRETPARGAAPAPDRDLTAVYQNLCQDPALRHSEKGRLLLRLLSALALPVTEWRSIADEVPAHRAGAVADLATEYARLWREFADRARAGAPDSPAAQ
ncbi:ParB and winged helix-turn-helix domain-containing protein [Streptomyces sp. KMM 9044]|uniref:ParB and winged helix-turn-helix domain-containing protein n=1 Tax=Streptomyces sp. KMM 9044 TaxID=2744474 RepID=UPI002151E568|nr:ParB N-terminal domain-containing protein [Streptomyces sp. KMM 9044]WAX81238.1 ParB N-terminal domain-containing protein [Streptomyces sp. KMM 9044]